MYLLADLSCNCEGLLITINLQIVFKLIPLYKELSFFYKPTTHLLTFQIKKLKIRESKLYAQSQVANKWQN